MLVKRNELHKKINGKAIAIIDRGSVSGRDGAMAFSPRGEDVVVRSPAGDGWNSG
jgi:hypothetical protein